MGGELFEGVADDQRAEGVDGGDDDLIAATNGEGEAVAFMGAVGGEDDVCGGVVGVGVHRVRAVEGAGGGEADVAGGEGGELSRHGSDKWGGDRVLGLGSGE